MKENICFQSMERNNYLAEANAADMLTFLFAAIGFGILLTLFVFG